MALLWDWNEKCGEATLWEKRNDGTEQEFPLTLYKGNAFLIMLYEFTDDDGTDKYDMVGFFVDKDHAKNCFGLNKKGGHTDNMYEREWQKITRIRLNKSKYPYTKELVQMLSQAFDNITIEIYSEDG